MVPVLSTPPFCLRPAYWPGVGVANCCDALMLILPFPEELMNALGAGAPAEGVNAEEVTLDRLPIMLPSMYHINGLLPPPLWGVVLVAGAALEANAVDVGASSILASFVVSTLSQEFGQMLKIGGIVMSTQRDEAFYHEPLVHVPMLLSDAANVVVLGGGDGGSVREALKHVGVERVDVFELDWAVVEVTREWMPWLDAGAWADPRVHLQIDDGLVLLSTYIQEGRRADALVLDLTDPDPRSSPLYAPAAMALYRESLSERGVLSLHLGLALIESDKERIASTLSALRATFAHVEVYWSIVPFFER